MKKLYVFLASSILSCVLSITAFAGEWKQDNSGWKYYNDNSYIENSWKEINGQWYYFNERGYMLSDTTTPDGYAVGKSGEWIQPKQDIINSSEKYSFDSDGLWVNKNKIPEGEYIYYPQIATKEPIVKGSSCIAGNFNYIKLYSDDIVKTGTYIPASKSVELDISHQGMFLVGKDIKAGTYNLKGVESDGSKLVIPTCIVYNSIPSKNDETAPQKNVSKDFSVGKWTRNTITVTDGQYIQLIDASADFVRP
ncbi:hypothetical protein [Clostridium sp. HBUAS56010]|uniref:hypothetical protein n=1 Tax=Clostridium sp. HBUAS56010 TaxID=2571127 RepID=UPI00117853D6|nr:hypothetical protein [Clostridium sp. HBUAS56010]